MFKIFLLDGNFIVYTAANVALWNSESVTHGDRAVIQDDGNFVIYRGHEAKWATYKFGSC